MYQPHLGASQRHLVQAGAIPFDITFNINPNTREYELFRSLDEHHRAMKLPQDAFWGLISTKFEHKSVSTFQEFLVAAKDARMNGFDCYLYNPMLANAAIYANTWEQGMMTGHAGLYQVAGFLQDRGYPIDDIQGVETFFFCNYICGNDKFWKNYFLFCGEVLSLLEREHGMGTAIGEVYANGGGYHLDQSITMRPFIIERLLGNYVAFATREIGLKAAVFTPTEENFIWKFGQRTGVKFFGLYSQKNASIELRDQSLADKWNNDRREIIKAPSLALQADDPPSWLRG